MMRTPFRTDATFRAYARALVATAVLCAAWLSTPASLAQGVLAAPAQSGPLNSMAEAADNAGIKQCRAQLSALSALGTQGTTGNDLLLDWDRKRANHSPVFSLIGLQYESSAAAMSMSAVPEADGSCSVSAERISVAPVACKTLAGRELRGYRATPLLRQMTVYTDSQHAGSSVSLIDSPSGCLVIRRYVAFSKAASAQ